jgi:hypothetical protein
MTAGDGGMPGLLVQQRLAFSEWPLRVDSDRLMVALAARKRMVAVVIVLL